jgi:hypothetical protein
MSLPIHVDAYSGYKANERPREFVLDEEIYEARPRLRTDPLRANTGVKENASDSVSLRYLRPFKQFIHFFLKAKVRSACEVPYREEVYNWHESKNGPKWNVSAFLLRKEMRLYPNDNGKH